MEIEAQKVVTLHYTLTDSNGTVIDQSSDGSFCYLHGANNIIIGLEDALKGKKSGNELEVSIPPEKGYGLRDDSRVQQVPKNIFPDGSEVTLGAMFSGQGPNGEPSMVTVTKIEGETVTVDGNHPLAGEKLHFDVKIVDVRDATVEEIEHGHVHGSDSH